MMICSLCKLRQVSVHRKNPHHPMICLRCFMNDYNEEMKKCIICKNVNDNPYGRVCNACKRF